MAKPRITLYIDVISPFAYMAYYMLRHSPVFQQCDKSYIPVSLGGIHKACGNVAPVFIKNKDKWIDVERNRWASQFNIPICETPPVGFPFSTIAILRALTALTTTPAAAQLPDVLDILYRLVWVERNVEQVEKPDNLQKVLSGIIGEAEAKKVMEMSMSLEVKKLTLQRGDEAMAEGCFGLPYFLATNAQGQKECFWGFDHFGQVVDHLGLDRLGPGGGWRVML